MNLSFFSRKGTMTDIHLLKLLITYHEKGNLCLNI